MKFNTLFVAVISASTLFASCSYQTGLDKQRKYVNATLADADAFRLIKYVTENGNYLVSLADYADKASTSSDVKTLAGKIREVYGKVLPETESLGLDLHVGDGERGVPPFEAPKSLGGDSTTTFNAQAFKALVAEKQGEINTRVSREEKNTNPSVIHYSEESLNAMKEVFELAGGKEEHHHH